MILFSPRFAPLVETGEKPHTIRGRRKREIRAGDTLDLRRWSGAPYRSKQVKLRVEQCLSARPITIEVHRGVPMITIRVNSWRTIALREGAAQALAWRDGFRNLAEMIAWFEQTHGLPFQGVLIQWAV